MSVFGWLLGPRDYLDSLGSDANVYPLSAAMEAIHTLADGSPLYSDVEQIPAVSAARRVLASVAASLPIIVERDGEPLEGFDIPAVVRRPDPFTGRQRFIYETVDAMIRGDAYWTLAGQDPQGHPSTARVLPHGDVRVEWADPRRRMDRRYYHRTTGEEYAVGDGGNLVHIPLDPAAGVLTGRSPLDSPLFQLMAAAEASALSWFHGDGEPIGNLHSTTPLAADEALDLSRQWRAARRVSRVGVTSGSVSYDKIGSDPSEAQLLETRRYHALETARLMRIPGPLLLAELQGSGLIQYANLSTLYTELIRSTLGPEYLTPIEAAWTELLPRTHTVRFDTTVYTQAGERVETRNPAGQENPQPAPEPSQ